MSFEFKAKITVDSQKESPQARMITVIRGADQGKEMDTITQFLDVSPYCLTPIFELPQQVFHSVTISIPELTSNV